MPAPARHLVVDTSVLVNVELDCAFVTADRRLHDRIRSLPRMIHLSRIEGAFREPPA